MSNSFKKKATEWGKIHEIDGKKMYVDKLKNDHINFSVTDSGLVINPNISFIGAASPDGIVYCDSCGK